MRIKGGSSHVGAIKNLLYRDGVVVSFANQGVEGVAQKLLCPCDPTIWRLGYLDGHFSPSRFVLTDKMPMLSPIAHFRGPCSSPCHGSSLGLITNSCPYSYDCSRNIGLVEPRPTAAQQVNWQIRRKQSRHSVPPASFFTRQHYMTSRSGCCLSVEKAPFEKKSFVSHVCAPANKSWMWAA